MFTHVHILQKLMHIPVNWSNDEGDCGEADSCSGPLTDGQRPLGGSAQHVKRSSAHTVNGEARDHHRGKSLPHKCVHYRHCYPCCLPWVVSMGLGKQLKHYFSIRSFWITSMNYNCLTDGNSTSWISLKVLKYLINYNIGMNIFWNKKCILIIKDCIQKVAIYRSCFLSFIHSVSSNICSSHSIATPYQTHWHQSTKRLPNLVGIACGHTQIQTRF